MRQICNRRRLAPRKPQTAQPAALRQAGGASCVRAAGPQALGSRMPPASPLSLPKCKASQRPPSRAMKKGRCRPRCDGARRPVAPGRESMGTFLFARAWSPRAAGGERPVASRRPAALALPGLFAHVAGAHGPMQTVEHDGASSQPPAPATPGPGRKVIGQSAGGRTHAPGRRQWPARANGRGPPPETPDRAAPCARSLLCLSDRQLYDGAVL